MPVVLGLERLLVSRALKGRRVGLVSNPASVDSSLIPAAERLKADRDVTLAALFGPQHGFRADVQDDMIETPHERDPQHLPVYSLYSETREPTAEMLGGLDTLVIDLQDIGARIYTFIYTMANCLRACRKHGVRVLVCDRPNPIGGEAVDGPVLVEGYESFVGQFEIPMRHGMTIGELARLFNEHFGIGADLEVIGMDGWQRSMYFDATGLPWVMPSPNMPTLDAATVFPGTVLFEGTNLSEGRGTTRPFEIVGAPWIDGQTLAASMNALALRGVHFRPVFFEPTFQKHARQTCGGCQIHVLDRPAFRPVLCGVALIGAFKNAPPPRFAWRQPPYEYEHTKMPIDVLAGSDLLRRQVDSDTALDDIAESWRPGLEAFMKIRKEYLLY